MSFEVGPREAVEITMGDLADEARRVLSPRAATLLRDILEEVGYSTPDHMHANFALQEALRRFDDAVKEGE